MEEEILSDIDKVFKAGQVPDYKTYLIFHF